MTTSVSFKPAIVDERSLADLFISLPIEAKVLGAADQVMVTHIAPLDLSGEGAFAFLSNSALKEQLFQAQASVVVLTQTDYDWLIEQAKLNPHTCYVICKKPYVVYAFVAQQLYLNHSVQAGVNPSAIVDPSAQLGDGVRIEAHAVIGQRVVLGQRVIIHAGAVLGDDVTVGDDSVIYPNVTIYHSCVVGSKSIIHSGTVIGADGFGFAPTPMGWQKIPQIGRVVIGNNVEIGANTSIDRGALSDTVIGNGVKLDNQIQIAHNCVIGDHTAIASCAGIAGSTTIGKNCMIGGAAMIGGHLTIVDNTIVSAATAVPSSITESGQYSGVFPPMPHRDWERNASLIRHLSDLRKRLRTLEKIASINQ